MINRQSYINKILKFKDKKIIKIITGIHRCGKSTLMKMFKEKINSKNVIYINFEDLEFEKLKNYKDLYDFIISHLKNGQNYIFIDEIQIVDGFEKAINSLFLKDNVDIYLTGSNATMLSGEIATLLSGRYILFQMLPLSFNEILSVNENLTYKNYISNTTFPYAINLEKTEQNIYLNSLYSTILLKDVVQRYSISDVMALESVLKFLMSNIGSLVSSKKISDTLSSNGKKISTQTTERYINAFKNCFIIYQVNRYDIKGKEFLKSLEKYYVCDVALRNFLIPQQSSDIGHILENIVYLELLRRDYEIYIGKFGVYEIDFICKKITK